MYDRTTTYQLISGEEDNGAEQRSGLRMKKSTIGCK
jgi:hypothetical protein